MIYDRRHNYEIKEYGGLATPMPVFATLFLLITLSSIGLPMMNGFVGEFLILSGAFQARAIYGILAASGVIWGAFYMGLAIAISLIATLWLGVLPNAVLHYTQGMPSAIAVR